MPVAAAAERNIKAAADNRRRAETWHQKPGIRASKVTVAMSVSVFLLDRGGGRSARWYVAVFVR